MNSGSERFREKVHVTDSDQESVCHINDDNVENTEYIFMAQHVDDNLPIAGVLVLGKSF